MSPTPDPPDRTRALAGALGLLYLGVYGLTASGHLYLTDAASLLETARALVLDQTLSIPFDPGYGGAFDSTGRFYSQYGLGAVIAAIPAMLAGEGLTRVVGDPSLDPVLSGIPLAFMNVIWCTGSLVLFHRIASQETGERTARTLTHLLGLTSLIWVYAGSDFSEPLLGFLLLLAARPSPEGATDRDRFASGLAFGSAMLVKFTAILALPGIAWRLHDGRPRSLAPLAVGPGLATILIFGYNAIRFGHPLETGYALEVQTFRIPIWMGLYGLLFSVGKGLLVHNPLLALMDFRTANPRTPGSDRSWILVTVVPSLAFFAVHQNWDGDWSFGPRYLVPFLPFLFLALIPALERPDRITRTMVVVLAALGVVVQMAGVLVDHTDYTKFLAHRKSTLGDYLPDRTDKVHIPFHAHHFNPDLAPIRGHYYLLGSWIRRQNGATPAPMTVFSSVEEENDRSGHRLTPLVELGPPEPGQGRPDVWWIVLLPLVGAHPLLLGLYLGALAALARCLTRGRARLRRLDRADPGYNAANPP